MSIEEQSEPFLALTKIVTKCNAGGNAGAGKVFFNGKI
jgi:hypothetical protein